MTTVADLINAVSHLDPTTPILWMVVDKDLSRHSEDWTDAEWATFVDECTDAFADDSANIAKNLMCNW